MLENNCNLFVYLFFVVVVVAGCVVVAETDSWGEVGRGYKLVTNSGRTVINLGVP